MYLVCHQTRQEVHVLESGGFGVRGADDELVVAAFCDAHAFKHQLEVLAEERSNDDEKNCVLWTAENVERQYRLVAGEYPDRFPKAFAERLAGR